MLDESIYSDEITTPFRFFYRGGRNKTEMEIKEKEIKIEKSTKEEAPPLIKEKTTAKGNVFIVLGSFKDEKNANDFMRTLQSKHANAVDLGKGDKSGLWMIGIGPYELPKAQKVLKENKLNGWILKK